MEIPQGVVVTFLRGETNRSRGCCFAERHLMTIEDDVLRQALCTLIRSPALELPDYSADPVIRRRVGAMLSGVEAKSLRYPLRKY
jgi:hypothetical protein